LDGLNRISSMLFCFLLEVIRRKRPDRSLPHLVVVGDFLQVPPRYHPTDECKYSWDFCFSTAVGSMSTKLSKFSHNFFENVFHVHRVFSQRFNICQDLEKAIPQSRGENWRELDKVVPRTLDGREDFITVTDSRTAANMINFDKVIKEGESMNEYQAFFTLPEDTDIAKLDLPIQQCISLRVGARVMIRSKVDVRPCFNVGSQGIVVSFIPSKQAETIEYSFGSFHSTDRLWPVVKLHSGVQCAFGLKEFPVSNEIGIRLGFMSQLPISLSWAVASTEIEGLRFDGVRIIDTFKRPYKIGLALSRVGDMRNFVVCHSGILVNNFGERGSSRPRTSFTTYFKSFAKLNKESQLETVRKIRIDDLQDGSDLFTSLGTIPVDVSDISDGPCKRLKSN
jgi:hypothetical protein